MSQSVGPNPPTLDNSKIIGPALPPHLVNKSSSASDIEDNDNENNAEKSPKVEPKGSIIGPALPPHLLKTNTTVETSSDEDTLDVISPNLESSTNTENKNLADSLVDASYGPALPPYLKKVPVQENSDEEDVYGPLPPGVATSSQAYQALEERALQIKLGQLDSNEDKGTIREEWMVELPDVHAGNLGLGPRQFRKNQRPDFSDRSSWTDTPEQKEKKLQGKAESKKLDLKKEAELREIHKRDDEQRKLAEKHNRKKKRDKSLLELHQDELKKKKKDEKEGTTRRPFSREIDLQVNRLDDAQKKSMMKKAMHLDDKFSKGQSEFL